MCRKCLYIVHAISKPSIYTPRKYTPNTVHTYITVYYTMYTYIHKNIAQPHTYIYTAIYLVLYISTRDPPAVGGAGASPSKETSTTIHNTQHKRIRTV